MPNKINKNTSVAAATVSSNASTKPTTHRLTPGEATKTHVIPRGDKFVINLPGGTEAWDISKPRALKNPKTKAVSNGKASTDYTFSTADLKEGATLAVTFTPKGRKGKAVTFNLKIQSQPASGGRANGAYPSEPNYKSDFPYLIQPGSNTIQRGERFALVVPGPKTDWVVTKPRTVNQPETQFQPSNPPSTAYTFTSENLAANIPVRITLINKKTGEAKSYDVKVQ